MLGNWGTATSGGRKLSFVTGRNAWLSGTALSAAAVVLPQLALANPTDGYVAAGNVNIVTVSPNQLDIVQSSKKAIINWGARSARARPPISCSPGATPGS